MDNIFGNSLREMKDAFDDSVRAVNTVFYDSRRAVNNAKNDFLRVIGSASAVSTNATSKPNVGGKLWAVPPEEASLGLASRVILRGERKAPKSLAKQLTTRRQVIGPRTIVTRQEVPYWQEQGWFRNNGELRGYYETPYGRWRGKIEKVYSGFDYYVHDPPYCLEDHSHWVCFQSRGDGWYLLHFSKEPRSISAGIIEMERIITEAYRR